MGRESYLTKSEQFASVYSKGGSWANNLVVLKALPNGLPRSRFGFSVSKRLGKAVRRNRVKRLLREIVRQSPLQPGWDLVLIARVPAAGAGYDELSEKIEGLLSRAKLLSRNHETAVLKTN